MWGLGVHTTGWVDSKAGVKLVGAALLDCGLSSVVDDDCGSSKMICY